MCSWHGLFWSGMRVCERVLLPAGRWRSQACTALRPCQYDGWFGLDGGRTRTSLAPLLWDVLKSASVCERVYVCDVPQTDSHIVAPQTDRLRPLASPLRCCAWLTLPYMSAQYLFSLTNEMRRLPHFPKLSAVCSDLHSSSSVFTPLVRLSQEAGARQGAKFKRQPRLGTNRAGEI
ncbi:hypothetical protein Q8A67_018085 [Cirrhinus molitorella]|uniref:Uncharacterized protein n=1 Tax=Cirrhinus molitorella TaxID=172907 RepID=A0AA88P8H0_9TELE|nr:hypothetical protein Q8A67_018085 [Cirrhinus molitorella]